MNIKYFEVELLDGVQCFTNRAATPQDNEYASEIQSSSALAGIDISIDSILLNLTKIEIKNPIYKTDKDLKVGDIVYVPIGKSNNNKSKIKKFIKKPDFYVRGINNTEEK